MISSRSIVWVALLALSGCRPRLTFDRDALPAAHVGRSYRAEVNIGNAKTPVFSVVVAQGALPPGLVLEHLREEPRFAITGTPTTPGEYRAVFSVACYGTSFVGQTALKTLVLRVE